MTMMKSNLFQVFLSIFLTTSVYADCMGRTSTVRNGKEYRIFFEKKTNSEAMEACKEWGQQWKSPNISTLLQNIDNSLQTCMKEMIQSSQKNFSPNQENLGFHLGAIKWVGGERVSMIVDNGAFQKWASNQPRRVDASGQKRCMTAAMWKKQGMEVGDWVERSCKTRMFYICEREVSQDLVWGYSENSHAVTPENWHKLPGSAACGSKRRQSPQDLQVSELNFCSTDGPQSVSGWATDNDATVNWEVRNTGRMIEIRFNPSHTLYSNFGSNGTKLYVEYVHIKFGETFNTGSEHTFKKLRHAGEIQIFHYPNAEGERHAISFLIQQRTFRSNNNWSPFLDQLYQIKNPHTFATMKSPTGHLEKLLTDDARVGRTLEYTTETAVRYEGSLTHPPCTENVIWTVHPRTIQVSMTQFSIIRQLRMEGREGNRYRPITQTTRSIQPESTPHCLLSRV